MTLSFKTEYETYFFLSLRPGASEEYYLKSENDIIKPMLVRSPFAIDKLSQLYIKNFGKFFEFLSKYPSYINYTLALGFLLPL